MPRCKCGAGDVEPTRKFEVVGREDAPSRLPMEWSTKDCGVLSGQK